MPPPGMYTHTLSTTPARDIKPDMLFHALSDTSGTTLDETLTETGQVKYTRRAGAVPRQ